jgi:pilus assembly protein Flp/PilA
MEKIRRFLKDEEGVTAIEYGLIAAIIAIAVVGGVTTIGASLKTIFGAVSPSLTAPAG